MTSSGEMSLTRDEFNKLLLVCDDQEDKLLLMVGVSLGLRRSDMMSLEIKNIDFINKTISYKERKKNNRFRSVHIGPRLINEIKIFIKLNKMNYTDKLFSFGERQSWNRFNKLCDKAGINRRPIMCLRSTCCKFYLSAGYRADEVAEIVGDSVSTIYNHYMIPNKEELERKIDKLEVI